MKILTMGLTLLTSISTFATTEACMQAAASAAALEMSIQTGQEVDILSYESKGIKGNALVPSDGLENIKVHAQTINERSSCTLFVKVTDECKVKKIIPTYCQG